jgi:hypothetical protein
VSSVGLVKALGGGWNVAQMTRETGDVAAPALPASGVQTGQGANKTAQPKTTETASASTPAQAATAP